MTGPEVLDVARDAIVTLVLVVEPADAGRAVVGVVISLFQALTQIQEMTLVFVPKILAIFIAMLIALPFMADVLQGHMMRLAARMRRRSRRMTRTAPHARDQTCAMQSTSPSCPRSPRPSCWCSRASAPW